MKSIFSLSVLSIFLLGFAYLSGQEIRLEEYEGKTVRYCDKVYGTYQSDKVALINLGADYPEQKMTIAIFQSDWNKFKYKPAKHLKGKNICVSGKVKMYKGKPEIIANSPNQIEIQ